MEVFVRLVKTFWILAPVFSISLQAEPTRTTGHVFGMANVHKVPATLNSERGTLWTSTYNSAGIVKVGVLGASGAILVLGGFGALQPVDPRIIGSLLGGALGVTKIFDLHVRPAFSLPTAPPPLHYTQFISGPFWKVLRDMTLNRPIRFQDDEGSDRLGIAQAVNLTSDESGKVHAGEVFVAPIRNGTEKSENPVSVSLANIRCSTFLQRLKYRWSLKRSP
jgi:hypothetical protein